MKEIELTQGKVTVVDEADFPFLSSYKWWAQKGGKTWYAVREHRGKKILMHRVLTAAPLIFEVDHVDGDGLNNRRANLRLCTCAQNACNRRAVGFSKYLGVSLYRRINKWQVRYRSHRKTYFVGYFESEILAALAYDDAVEFIHGPFARFNFPEVR